MSHKFDPCCGEGSAAVTVVVMRHTCFACSDQCLDCWCSAASDKNKSLCANGCFRCLISAHGWALQNLVQQWHVLLDIESNQLPRSSTKDPDLSKGQDLLIFQKMLIVCQKFVSQRQHPEGPETVISSEECTARTAI